MRSEGRETVLGQPIPGGRVANHPDQVTALGLRDGQVAYMAK
jgi:hypothetical protein